MKLKQIMILTIMTAGILCCTEAKSAAYSDKSAVYSEITKLKSPCPGGYIDVVAMKAIKNADIKMQLDKVKRQLMIEKIQSQHTTEPAQAVGGSHVDIAQIVEAIKRKICKLCPANATCDGVDVKCKDGYEYQVEYIGKEEGIVAKCVPVVTTCKSNQYVVNKQCLACPANATCNGKIAKCNSGYENISKDLEKVVCKKVETKCKSTHYIVSNKCVACPKGATCDGENASCPYGYTKDKNGNVICNTSPVCKASQYLVNNKCTNCPANATCNGKVATCKKGTTMTTDKTGKVTCTAVPTCKASQYLVNNKCTSCPANAKCNGKTAACTSGYATAINNSTGAVSCKAKKCQQGSHDSTTWIKAHYKNCTNCRKENIKAGACSKNKKAHVHYYCDCDC